MKSTIAVLAILRHYTLICSFVWFGFVLIFNCDTCWIVDGILILAPITVFVDVDLVFLFFHVGFN